MTDYNPSEANHESDIAIIGMAGRFPAAANIPEFWKNLVEGKETVTRFSEEQLQSAGVAEATLRRPDYVRMNHVLEGVEFFDADFFSITPHEAENIDPQQRLLLECAQEVLDNAGYDPSRYKGSIGVFTGVGFNSYLAENLSERYRAASTVERYQLGLANDKDFSATRISYKLDLHGPSMLVGTACSTSLVALHMACLSVLSGQCNMALVGAASVRFPQVAGYVFQEGMILSPDGKCRAFDNEAQGTVLGDGVAMVMVKSALDAIADGDNVLAIIKATAINNDGSLKGGYTAPSETGQAEVIRDALALSGVPVESIGYVEAHGTGTRLGDPIEIAALCDAFQHWTGKKQFCGIGSVKTNIGHLDVAAGLAGVIKTVLMLKNKAFVPSLHFNRPSDEIDFAASPFYVVNKAADWVAGDGPRRACVSSFGIGGTNAHIVLEEAPEPRRPAPDRECELLLVSAKTRPALKANLFSLGQHFHRHHDLRLRDIAYTISAGRRVFSQRRAFVCDDARGAAFALALAKDEEHANAIGRGDNNKKIGFLFPAEGGADAPEMKDLYENVPKYRQVVDSCVSAFDERLAFLAQDGWGGHHPSFVSVSRSLAAFTRYFAVSRLFMEMGIQPSALLGSGIGELAGACLAGAMSLERACDLVFLVHGARELEGNAGQIGQGVVSETWEPSVRIASSTGPNWLSVPDIQSVERWKSVLLERDEPLADHPMLEDMHILLDLGSGMSPFRGQFELAGQQQGEGNGSGGRQYSILSDGRRLVSVSPWLDHGSSSWRSVLVATGLLWEEGLDVDTAALHPELEARRVALPGYSFERKRYFVDPAVNATHTASGTAFFDEVMAASPGSRGRMIARHLQGGIGEILGLGPDDLPRLNSSMLELGLDSLTMIEMAARLGAELNMAIPASDFVEFPTIAAFSDNLARLLGGDKVAPPIPGEEAVRSVEVPQALAPRPVPHAQQDLGRRARRRSNLWTG